MTLSARGSRGFFVMIEPRALTEAGPLCYLSFTPGTRGRLVQLVRNCKWERGVTEGPVVQDAIQQLLRHASPPHA